MWERDKREIKHTYVTVPEKADHFVIISDFEILVPR